MSLPIVSDQTEAIAEAYRALGSPTRLRIFAILAEKERYCGDLVKLFDLSQSTISHHLKALREAGLIDAEERGVSTCYRVNRARIEELRRQFDALVAFTPTEEADDDGERSDGSEL